MDDVVIVGFGPVGQLAALLLGRYGWRVRVFERRDEPYGLPRAVHVDDEVMRAFQGAGVVDAVSAIVDAPITYVWRNADGQTLLDFDLTGLGPHGWPASVMFSQPDLERILIDAVAELDTVAVHRGRAVVGVSPGEDSVRVEVAGAEPVDARYVIGCDGASSRTREVVGAAVHDLGFTYDWLVVDVRPGNGRVWDPPALQVCDPARPTTAVPAGPGRRRFEFMLLPGERPAEMERADTVWRLLAPWEITPDSAELERHAVYTFRARWAEQWRSGRVLIAGDAAHEMPPFAGQGLAAGIRDVANLVWKLDLVLAGRAPESILDSYPSERLGHLRVAVTISVELGKVICVLDPAAAATRDEGMIAGRAAGAQAIVPPPSPPLGPGLVRADDPLAGQAFPQYPVTGGRFDDAVSGSDGAALLVVMGEAAPVPDPGGGPGIRAVGIGDLADVEGRYADWFAGHGRAAVLVRPDHHIFGSAESEEDVPALLAAFAAAFRG